MIVCEMIADNVDRVVYSINGFISCIFFYPQALDHNSKVFLVDALMLLSIRKLLNIFLRECCQFNNAGIVP